MSNDFSAKARNIFADSLQIESARRPDFLNTACGDDQELRAEVEALLAAVATATRTQPFSPAFVTRGQLAPGRILAGRFTILRYIAGGGMGEVYEAHDSEVGENVALKTIRLGGRDEQLSLERFRREVQLSRKVAHPNVCKVFDLAYDEAPDGGRITFLTMEFLAGETLGRRLGSAKSTADILPVAVQIAQALDAIHSAGIIHRDFKPGNVILVPGERGERAVVTDFGLARRSPGGPDGNVHELTTAGSVVGTLAYMAPEQLRGGEITPAVDIYALGAVLYEMVTGTRPFADADPIVEANKRLTEDPPSPRATCPTLDPAWEKLILRCLARDPEDRYASALDVSRALQGERVRPPKRTRRRVAVAVALSALTLSAATLIPRFLGTGTKHRRSIAVLRLKNVTGRPDSDWVSTNLSEGIRTQLAGAERVRTISGQETVALEKDFALAGYDSLGKDTLARLHRVGTDLVILGSYTDLGRNGHGEIHLALQIQDAAAGETIGTINADGNESQIANLISDAGRRLRTKLGLADITGERQRELAAAQPSAEAGPAYSEALAKLRSYDAQAARNLLQEAIAADPGYPFAHAALAEAWSILGYDAKAAAESKKAFQLSGKLGLEDRLLIEGRYHEMIADWKACIENYSQLYKYFPDNVEYALKLAHAQMLAGQGNQALGTLSKIPASYATDGRVDLERAAVLAALGDYKGANAAATSSSEKAKANGTRLLEARALIWTCAATRKLGRLEQAKAACQRARDIDSAVGDRLGSARAATGLANIFNEQGDIAGARALYEEALRTASDIGSKRDMSGALNNLGNLFAAQGQNELAKARYEDALALEKEIGFANDLPNTLTNLGDLFRQEGKLADAAQFLGEAIERARESGLKDALSAALTNSAEVMFARGQLTAAKKQYDEAISLQRELGLKRHLAAALDGLAKVLLASGDLPGAEKRYNDALAINRELADKGSAATNGLGLAAVLLERGHPHEAESAARAAMAEFQAEKSASDEALARLTVARALLAQDRRAEALAEIDAGMGLASGTTDAVLRNAVSVVQARIRCAANPAERSAAVASLRTAAAQAKKLGIPEQELDAELAIAEIERASGKPTDARRRLDAVRSKAAALGFGLIAARAV